jgi:deoxyribodipyrimidine photo-lyase
MGADYSSKLSPWLACGAISSRYVYHETKRFEAEFLENGSTKHFIFHLFVRDFYHWYCFKYGSRVFYQNGALDKEHEWNVN